MAYVKIQPPGVVPLRVEDRKNIIRVISGDTWVVDINLTNPRVPQEPATPDNSIVRVVLAETQFDNPIWAGSWYSGVYPDCVRKDLCHIRIPRDVTKSLRRGSYQFSLRVSDILQTTYATEVNGSFLVEYAPTSDQHSIPYKDGTGETSETLEVVRDIAREFDDFKSRFDFRSVSELTEKDSLGKTKDSLNALLAILKSINKDLQPKFDFDSIKRLSPSDSLGDAKQQLNKLLGIIEANKNE